MLEEIQAALLIYEINKHFCSAYIKEKYNKTYFFIFKEAEFPIASIQYKKETFPLLTFIA